MEKNSFFLPVWNFFWFSFLNFNLKRNGKNPATRKKENLNIIKFKNLPNTQSCQDDNCAFFSFLLMRFFKNITPKTYFLKKNK